jgi:hypothetical protein
MRIIRNRILLLECKQKQVEDRQKYYTVRNRKLMLLKRYCDEKFKG